MCLPDALSRTCLKKEMSRGIEQFRIHEVNESFQASTNRLNSFREMTKSDQEFQKVKKYMQKDGPRADTVCHQNCMDTGKSEMQFMKKMGCCLLGIKFSCQG